MRNLIPRLQVVVARDKARAERVLADLTPGQEVFLAPLTSELIKVSDQPTPETAHVLGVVPSEWSGRIKATEASGRKCRAWFVGDLPPEKSPDGSFRMVLTVWCSSLSSPSGWRDLSVDELLDAARKAEDMAPRPAGGAGPFRPTRLFDAPSGPAQSGAAPSGAPSDTAPSDITPSDIAPSDIAPSDTVTAPSEPMPWPATPAEGVARPPVGQPVGAAAVPQPDRAEKSGLSTAQIDLIKEAVRRKLASKAE